MKKFIYQNKKGEIAIEITINEEKGMFRYLGAGSFGAGCGCGGFYEAKQAVFEGMSKRKMNTVTLVK